MALYSFVRLLQQGNTHCKRGDQMLMARHRLHQFWAALITMFLVAGPLGPVLLCVSQSQQLGSIPYASSCASDGNCLSQMKGRSPLVRHSAHHPRVGCLIKSRTM
eukprot:5107286-Amphidinium_carterae.1